MRKASSFWCVLICLLAGGAEAWQQCKPFSEIFANGQELCNKMFGDAFVYTTDEDKAYTMWFFDESQEANKEVTAALGFAEPDTCGLVYAHKEVPSPEGDDFTECHPWKQNSCCHEATTTSVSALRSYYGAGYEWDRCGPMTQACERFFVQEACFYECEVAAGLYRRYTDEQYEACSSFYGSYAASDNTVLLSDGSSYTCTGWENQWEMYQMPIKASYCDAWYTACMEDLFCGEGNYFDCATTYWAEQAALAANSSSALIASSEDLPSWAIGVIIACVALLICLVCVIFMMYRKEKEGVPIFTNVDDPAVKKPGKASAV